MLRVGVIGTGGIGSDHIRRLRSVVSGVSVVAVSDPDRARAEASIVGLGDVHITASGVELIDDPSVDAVLIASPGFTHAELVLACIQRGKPVFCEKPLAISVEDAWRIVQAEVGFGRRLVQVGFMRRYDPYYGALKRALTSGLVGQPLVIHAAHRNPDVPETWTTELTIKDSSVHDVDVIRYLTGDEIHSVNVLKPKVSSRMSGVQDPLLIVMETLTGVVVDVELSVNIAYGYDIRAEVVGEVGTLALGDGGLTTLKVNGRRSTDVPSDWRERFEAAYALELKAWSEAIVSDAPLGPSVWDGFVATLVAEASQRSYDSRQAERVVLPERPALYVA